MNDVFPLPQEQWSKYVEEAKRVHTFIQSNLDTAAKSSESDAEFGIGRGEVIGVGHLLTVLIYTDCRDFAWAFDRSYEQWKDAAVRRANFYWFSRFLFEAVHFFGNRFGDNRFTVKPLLYVIKSMHRFDSLAPTIHRPTGTYDSHQEAARKVNEQG